MKILDNAKKYLGVPYVWGGETLNEGGFDCSGYVYNVLKDTNINVPRDTAQGYYNRFKDNECNLNVPGALIFFGKSKKSITHIAINIDGVHMYESRGNKKNTKSKPGKGVCKSLIVRRKDLVAICSVNSNVSRETLYAPTPPLKRGSMGKRVEQLQKCLNVFGYGLVTDGVFGDKTFRALADFQKVNKLVIDGKYGYHTYDVLRGKLHGN